MSEKIYRRVGERVVCKTLPNGLPVYVVVKPGFARKYAFFATRYGGMDLRFQLNGQWLDTPAGIAHYLEHKMFDTEEGNALQELAKNGAEPNAFTSNAITGYYFDSTEHFKENLRILLSFVSVPYFTDESVEKEQGIIGQEIGMIEDNPEWQVYKRLMQALYHTSPARVSVAGSVESISHITARTLYDCHKAFYTPANMCLVAVGDLDAEEVFSLAEEVLPGESGPAIPRDYGQETDLTPMEAEVSCTQDGAAWEATLQCDYVPEGETTVEVLAPETIAGVKAVLSDGEVELVYEDQCLNAGNLSSQEVSPMACLPQLMSALRDGWLLEESEEDWQETSCFRLTVDQTGEQNGKILSTLWLRQEDGTPLRGEIAVDGEIILTADFTSFSFYNTIENQE